MLFDQRSIDLWSVFVLTFEHLILLRLRFQVLELSRFLLSYCRLDVSELLHMDFMLFLLPLGRENFTGLRLRSVHTITILNPSPTLRCFGLFRIKF